MKANREALLKKLRAILDKAESTTFGPERDALLAKADELMLKFAIEEHELIMAGESDVKPEVRTFDVCRSGNVIKDQLISLVAEIVSHARGRVVFYGARTAAKYDRPIRAKVVAFPSDLDYVEMLFTSLQLQLANEMEPKPDPSASVMENMSQLKACGLKWNRIFELLKVRAPGETAEYTADERRLVAQWRRWTKENGRDQELKGIHPTSYRRSYADGFVVEVSNRFYELAKAQRERDGVGTGTDLVLRDRRQVVNEFYDDLFAGKKIRTMPDKDSTLNVAGYLRGKEAGSRADLSRDSSRLRDRKALS